MHHDSVVSIQIFFAPDLLEQLFCCYNAASPLTEDQENGGNSVGVRQRGFPLSVQVWLCLQMLSPPISSRSSSFGAAPCLRYLLS